MKIRSKVRCSRRAYDFRKAGIAKPIRFADVYELVEETEPDARRMGGDGGCGGGDGMGEK